MTTSETLESAKSLIPYLGQYDYDSNKSQYLAYRYTGFSIGEACEMIGIKQFTVRKWRDRDSVFKELEEKSTGSTSVELRKQIVHTIYLRNYYRFLQKDEQIIRKSMDVDRRGNTIELSPQENQYLLRARQHYTPAQLEALSMAINLNDDDFNFGDFVLKRRTETLEVRFGKKDRANSENPEVDADYQVQ